MITSDPRKFGLSLIPHVLNLEAQQLKEQALPDAFPVGTILESVKVVKVETERGLVVEIQDDVLGYVHVSTYFCHGRWATLIPGQIRHVSDDHVPSLSPTSGHWKIGTVHRARVIGFYALDGIVQLSFQPSVLDQKFLQVQDVEVGEVLKVCDTCISLDKFTEII